MLALLLLVAAPAAPTAIDAERAFARDAQRIGQWTAFRNYAEPLAVVFTPQAAWAQVVYKDLRDPPRAIVWSPARSFVSCDRNLAINTGPWRNAKGQQGYFTTVWSRQKDGGWKWSVDGGDTLKTPLAARARPLVRRARCAGLARVQRVYAATTPSLEQIADKAPADAGQGRSADGTLTWSWTVAKDGARHFKASLWNGRGYTDVLDQRVAAPAR
ncbi:MAG: hypothetical protein ABIT69_01340 [Sphingomicrobium sp.]